MSDLYGTETGARVVNVGGQDWDEVEAVGDDRVPVLPGDVVDAPLGLGGHW